MTTDLERICSLEGTVAVVNMRLANIESGQESLRAAIAALRADMYKGDAELRAEMQKRDAELRAEMYRRDAELRAHIASLRNEMYKRDAALRASTV